MSKRWKPVERKLAAMLGGVRVPVSGRQRGYAPDIEHPWLALEVKSRKRMPVFLREAMDQAVKARDWHQRLHASSKMPMVVIHADDTHYDNSMVVVRLKDAREWWGVGKPSQADEEAM
jgi:Holliday junction resolvase